MTLLNYSNLFLKKKNLASYFKENGFNTICFRDQAADTPATGFYGRYLKAVTNDFDIICKMKKTKNYSFKNFFNEKKIFKFLDQNQKNFFFIHDYSLHDNEQAYSNGTAKSYLEAVNQSSKIVRNNLKTLNYNKKKDTLVFISDHGLNLKPSSKMHFSKKLNLHEYQDYYKDLFLDEKIKVTLFINFPSCKNKKIYNFYKPNFVFSLLKNFAKLNLNPIKMNKLFKNIKNKKNNILISIQAAKQDPYNNFFFKDYFHCHIMSLGKFRKIAYSHNHKYPFYNINDKKFIHEIKGNIKFKRFIKDYFSFKNSLNKLFIFIPSILLRFFNKITRLF